MSATTTVRRTVVSFAALALAFGCAPAEDVASSSTVEVPSETSGDDPVEEVPEEDYRLQVECQLSGPTLEPC